MDWVGRQLGVNKMDDCYKIEPSQLTTHTKNFIRRFFGNSLINAIKAVYPEYTWRVWKFNTDKSPGGFWFKKENQVHSLAVSVVHSL
jgi:hypothetical protein